LIREKEHCIKGQNPQQYFFGILLFETKTQPAITTTRDTKQPREESLRYKAKLPILG